MSISVVDFFDLASLAEASYADFSNFSKMEDALLASGFSETQADVIVARWSVKAHLPNTSTGFSMSIFEGVDGFVLAFRGTEPAKHGLVIYVQMLAILFLMVLPLIRLSIW